jgi:lambda repressor-like predicted transcriptional regulator
MTRDKYEALIDRIEDAEDRATAAAALSHEKALGLEAARADALPLELVQALSDGTHPLRVWRKHRGMTLDALSSETGIAQSYLTEIETRKKPGSFDAIIKSARALNVPIDTIAAWL